jgi:integrase
MPKSKDASFFLKDPKSTKPTLIWLHKSFKGEKPLKRSIGREIMPIDWDFTEQRPFQSRDKNINKIGQLIQEILDIIPVIKADCKRKNRIFSRSDMEAALDVILQQKNKTIKAYPEPTGNMFTDFETIIEGMKDGSILTPGKNKKRYKEATIKNYETRTLPLIRDFYEKNKLPKDWSTVTLNLYEKFISWCHNKNLANNSIGVYIKCWKRIGKLAFEKGWHSNNVFQKEEFMILKENTYDIYLNEEKIEKIYKALVPARHYDIARDWFILDCHLGLRVSDLQQIKFADFEGSVFQFVNEKTGFQVAIPIHPFVNKIIKKWKGLPPPMSDVKLNKYIKIVARIAGLTGKVIYTITKGGVLQKFVYQEWEMVSSHTCRRTCITNLLRLGFSHAQVMQVVGITRYETLMRYFKQTPEEAAKEMGQHAYYQK